MSKVKAYPEGTTFGNYFIITEGERYFIRRRVILPDGKRIEPRYEARLYSHLKTKAEFEAFVERLNHREGAKTRRKLEIQTAFIPKSLLDAYETAVNIGIPSKKNARHEYNTLLKRNFLDFFVNKLELPDPREWPKHQERWAAALLNKGDVKLFDRPMSRKTIKNTIQAANRFMKFLHLKDPVEFPLTQFAPLSKGAIREHEAQRLLDEDEPVGRFIPAEDWAKIDGALPPQIAPFIRLMYLYGLRLAESLGFTGTDCVKKPCLEISKQLATKPLNGEPTYATLKGKKKRRTMHWNCDAMTAYKLVEQTIVGGKMRPETLAEKWNQLMAKLDMPYKTHDCRRTFITSALRKYNPRDVQLGVGHENLATTMKYAQDDRDMSDETFDPSEAA